MHLFQVRFHRKPALFLLCLGLVALVCTATLLTFTRSPLALAQALLTNQVNMPATAAASGGTFHGCPAQGKGGDTQLNLLKNRMETASWQPISFSQLASFPYPASVLHHDMSTWSASYAAQVALYNGRPVSLIGYLVSVSPGSPEPANCNSSLDVDYHLRVGSSPTTPATGSIVTEATPRVRAKHPGWTLARLQTVASRHLPVRISGWTMLDPEDDGPV